MCIGIKPLFLPGISRNERLKMISNPISSTTNTLIDAPSSIVGVSRKRLFAEIQDEGSCISVDEESPKKMIRYPTCTCRCERECTQDRKSTTVGGCETEMKRRKQSLCSRKVRFSSFHAVVPSSEFIPDEERKDLWYSLDECAQMNEASKTAVHSYRQQHKDALRHILCVASQCSYSPPPMAYLETVRFHFKSEVRGLELGLLPLSVRQRRQEHVRKIVETQKQVHSSLIKDEEHHHNVLATQSSRSSQASRLLAQVLARHAAEDAVKDV